jgi:hypothetical protein
MTTEGQKESVPLKVKSLSAEELEEIAQSLGNYVELLSNNDVMSYDTPEFLVNSEVKRVKILQNRVHGALLNSVSVTP